MRSSFDKTCARIVSLLLASGASGVAVALTAGCVSCPPGETRLVLEDTDEATFTLLASEDDANASPGIPSEACLDACGESIPSDLQDLNLPLSACEPLRTAEGEPKVLCDFTYICQGGRRPAGHVRPRPTPSAGPVGDYLATMAHLEASSIAAFEDLATELSAFGAPRALVEQARRAQADERAHTALVGQLAARHGATVPAAVRRRRPSGSLATFARRNAREGCGSEAYGALAMAWAAQSAGDPAMRALAGRIARDEARHAELSFAVHTWAAQSLAPRAVARLRALRNATIRKAAQARYPEAVVTTLGLPPPAVAAQLAEQLIAAMPQA